MKTSYSRRELYALGEPIGDSSTYEIAGRRVYGGGGGGLGDLVSGVSDALSGVEDTVSDAYMGVRDPLQAGAVLAGNYFVPGSGMITSKLVSDEAQEMLDSDLGKVGMLASGGAGGMEGNMSNWNPSNWGGGGGESMFSGLSEMFGSGGPELLGDAGGYGPGAGSGLSELFGPEQLSGPGAGGSSLFNGLGKLLGGGSGSGGSGSGGLNLGGAALGAAGLAGLMSMLQKDSDKYGVPGRQDNVGPMGQFKYDPSKFTASRPDPAMFRPQGAPTAKIGYAGGGPVEQMSNANAIGANTGYPMADVNKATYSVPYQTPMPQNVVQGVADTGVNSMTGEQTRFARGGLSSLGGYSDGGRLLKGPGDGMSDNIPASIGRKQPARLADGEFVVPADVVSHLGNGSTDAGAKQLYKMMDRIRSARTGRKAQGKQIKADKYLPK
jgi:hypothetical protein